MKNYALKIENKTDYEKQKDYRQGKMKKEGWQNASQTNLIAF